jgi:drug/metabolite transporter (DMT)-like permease
MNSQAMVLVVVGALLHACWNFFAKKSAGGAAFVWIYGLVSSLAIVPILFLLPRGAFPEFGSSEGWSLLQISFFSGIAGLLYAVCLQTGYRKADMSVVYPVARGTGPLFAIVGAFCFLGERPALWGLIGIGLILLGIFLTAGGLRLLGNAKGRNSATTGISWGCITGLFIALYTLSDAWAVKSLAFHPVVFYSTKLWLKSIMLSPVALKDRQAIIAEWKKNKPFILAVGLLSPIAYLLVLFAVQSAPVSYVAPTREISMLVASFLAAWLLSEKLTRERLIGICLVLSGVVVIGVF